MSDKKLILDVTCGGRTIWFNKNHPYAVYADIREKEKGFITHRPKFEVKPDVVADFRNLPFADKEFKLVVWDPPHLKNISEKSWIGQKYGSLDPVTWKEDLVKGFNECMRVLDDHGILIFKWSRTQEGRPNRDISVKEILTILPMTPLFGHTTGSKSNTIWMCFMKIPSEVAKDV